MNKYIIGVVRGVSTPVYYESDSLGYTTDYTKAETHRTEGIATIVMEELYRTIPATWELAVFILEPRRIT